MDSQNVERRDSKKSNKSGGAATGGYKNQNRVVGIGGGGSINGGNGGAGEKPAGEKQRSHSLKAGKPYREIYKPPSLRTTKGRNSFSEDKMKYNDDKPSSGGNSSPKKGSSMNNTHFKNNLVGNNGNRSGSSSSSSPQQNGNNPDPNSDSQNMNFQNGYSLFGNHDGNGSNGNHGNSSVPSSPLISQRQMQQNAFNIGLAKQMLNVNAKEFQFYPMHQQQQQQQISNFLREFDPSLFYNANNPILATSGCYPLKQSKSSGNMNLLLQQQQQQQQQHQAQVAALQQLQQQLGFSFGLQPGNISSLVNSSPLSSTGVNNAGNGQFNRLSQSKSSGNVPGNGIRQRVRFDDEEPDYDDVEDFVGGQLGNYLASQKLNGDASGSAGSQSNFPRGYPFQQQQQQPNQSKPVPQSPQPVLKSSLQKSRTGFYLNLYGNQQPPQLSQTSPTKPMYGFSNSPSGSNSLQNQSSSNYNSKVSVSPSSVGQQSSPFHGTSNVVQRSRSFGPGTHHLPRMSAATLLTASRQSSSSTGHSIYTDFCIMKWPRVVQELVTAAVTGVDRIPARNWIEMVNGIFEAMLCDYRPTKKDRIFSTQPVGITNPTGADKMSGAAASSSINNDKGSGEMSTAAGGSPGKSQQNGCGGDSENASSAFSANSVGENNDLAISPDIDDTEDNDDEEEEDDDDDDTDLTSAAVHIFLYFIQREKDRTVMESLLNTCFASFQRLSSISLSNNSSSPSTKSGKSQLKRLMAQQIGKPSISRQWSNFLRFLSTLYSQVKLIRRQKQSQQQPGQSMDEMRFSLLALLCDSCLATLRSPQSYTAEMMGCLFTVLTSIGRDMEGTFPLKMKQLLAAVRDALLGIGPYHQQQQHHYPNSTSSSPSASRSSSLSPIVQKTLMQLIELHAANWQLPASAVRYYYSSVNSGSSGKSMTSSNANSSTSSSSTNKKANNNNYSNSNSDKYDNNASLPTSNNGIMTSDSPSKPLPNNKNNNDGNNEDKTKGEDGVTTIKTPCDDHNESEGKGTNSNSTGSSNSVELESASKPQTST